MTNAEIIANYAPIPGYESEYGIDKEGNVYSYKTNIVLRQCKVSSGYPSVSLRLNGKSKTIAVHRLMAITYLPRIPGKNHIDHIDTNKFNNRLENLRWCTPKENSNNPLTLKYINEHARRGENHPCYGKKRPREIIEKVRQKMIGHPTTEETRRKIGNANRGNKWTEEHRRFISESFIGKYLGAKSARAKEVLQYDKELNLIKVWPSIRDAERTLGILHSAIANCLSGRAKTAGGYIWKTQ